METAKQTEYSVWDRFVAAQCAACTDLNLADSTARMILICAFFRGAAEVFLKERQGAVPSVEQAVKHVLIERLRFADNDARHFLFATHGLLEKYPLLQQIRDQGRHAARSPDLHDAGKLAQILRTHAQLTLSDLGVAGITATLPRRQREKSPAHRRTTRWLVILVIVLLVFVAINAGWLWHWLSRTP